MDKVTIRAHISQAVAARDGALNYGSIDVQPTPQQWEELPLAVRQQAFRSSVIFIDTADPAKVWDGIVAKLTELAEQAAEEERKKIAEQVAFDELVAAAVQVAITVTDPKDWIAPGTSFTAAALPTVAMEHLRHADYHRLRTALRTYPEYMAIEREIVAALNEAHRDWLEKDHADRAAKQEAQRLHVEKRTQAMRAYVRENIPDLVQAVDAGYDVSRAGMDHLANRLGGDVVMTRGTEAWKSYGWEERPEPNKAAFAALEKAKAAVAKAPVLLGQSYTVERIMRIEDPDGRRRTGVVVHVEHEAYPDRAVIFYSADDA